MGKLEWNAGLFLSLCAFIAGCSPTLRTTNYEPPAMGDYSQYCEPGANSANRLSVLEQLLKAGSPTHTEEEVAEALLEKAAREIAGETETPDLCRAVLLAGNEAFQRKLEQ